MVGNGSDSERGTKRTLTGMRPVMPATAAPAKPATRQDEPIELHEEAGGEGGGYRHATTLTGMEKDGSIAAAVAQAVDYPAMYEQAQEQLEETRRQLAEAESTRQAIVGRQGELITQLAGQVEQLAAQNEVLCATNEALRRKLTRLTGKTDETAPAGGDELAAATERVAELARQNAALTMRAEEYRIRAKDPQGLADEAYQRALEALKQGHAPRDETIERIKTALQATGLGEELIKYRVALKELYIFAENACTQADAERKALQAKAAELSDLERKAQEIAAAEQSLATREKGLAESLETLSTREAEAQGITIGFEARRREFGKREAAQAEDLSKLDRKIRGGLQQEVGRAIAIYRNITSVMGICWKSFLGYQSRVRNIMTSLRETSGDKVGVSLLFTQAYTGLLIPEPNSRAIYCEVPPERHTAIDEVVRRAEENEVQSGSFETGSNQELGHYVLIPAKRDNTYVAHLCITGLKPDSAGMVPKPVRDKVKEIAHSVISDVVDEYATLYAINPKGGLKDIGVNLERLQRDIIKGV